MTGTLRATRARTEATFRYINAAEVEAYRRKGWTCSPMLGHHGCEGRWLAVKHD